MIPAPVMVDCPSWVHRGQLRAERVLSDGRTTCRVHAAYDSAVGHWRLRSDLADLAAAQLASFSTADLDEATPEPIRQSLATLDGLQRFGAGSYWEALGTAVIRQVIRADQARKVWHRLATALTHPDQATGGFPTAQRFLAASDAELAEAGLGFKIRALRTVAEACRSEHDHWDQFAPIGWSATCPGRSRSAVDRGPAPTG